MRVLVVEDDFRVAQVNRGFVDRVDGFTAVGIARTVAEAEQSLADLQPDLVILDLYLPDGSGLDLLRFMRHNGNPADVIVVTAAKEAAALQEALRGGAVDYILKPYRFERFAEALERYRAYRSRLDASGVVAQEEVDRLLAQRQVAAAKGQPAQGAAPKGIDALTLDRVAEALREAPEPLTAEEFGERTGLSRTTARRYLEYLVEEGRARVQPSYGRVGRPERLYGRLK